MKIIDLLNKIANHEELPEKIKVTGTTYYLCENDNSGQCYFTEKEGFGGFPLKFNTSQMNDEVEIIEENKQIEKLDSELNCDDDTIRGLVASVNEIYKEIADKINEIIEEINELKDDRK